MCPALINQSKFQSPIRTHYSQQTNSIASPSSWNIDISSKTKTWAIVGRPNNDIIIRDKERGTKVSGWRPHFSRSTGLDDSIADKSRFSPLRKHISVINYSSFHVRRHDSRRERTIHAALPRYWSAAYFTAIPFVPLHSAFAHLSAWRIKKMHLHTCPRVQVHVCTLLKVESENTRSWKGPEWLYPGQDIRSWWRKRERVFVRASFQFQPTFRNGVYSSC